VTKLRLSTFCLLVPLFAGACSSSSTSHGTFPGKKGESTCVEKRDQCFAAQQICVADGSDESCKSCLGGSYAKDPDTCALIPGDARHNDFGAYPLDPAEEINGLCQSWTLHNETELWVNAVELETNGGYHHSNWLFAPEGKYPGEDGAWKCSDRGYSE